MRLAWQPADMRDDGDTKVPALDGVEALRGLLDELGPWLRRMRRHWRSGVVAFGVLGALALLVAGLYPPSYRSEAVVFHQTQAQPTMQADDRLDLELMREMLLRRPRLERLVGELDVARDIAGARGIGAAVDEIIPHIGFDPVSDSTFRISYRGDSAEQARAVAQWLAEELVAEDRDRRRAQAAQTKTFVDAELARARAALAEHEAALGRFIDAHPQFSSAAPATTPATTPARRPAKRRAAPDAARLAERQAALEALARASRSLAEHERTYTERHPALAAARAAVRDAEARVAQASAPSTAPPSTAPPSTAPPSTAPPSTAPRSTAPAATPPEPASAATRDRGAAEAEHMRLSRAVEDARARTEQLAAEAFRAELATRSSGAGYDTRVVILDPAFLPAAPIRSRLFFVKIGMPLALLLALLWVAGRALIDDRIYHATDLEPAGFSLLAVLPDPPERTT